MLESDEFSILAELTEYESVAPSYMTRVMRLPSLAPDIFEAILDGKQAGMSHHQSHNHHSGRTTIDNTKGSDH